MKAVKLRNYNAALQRAQFMVDSYKIVSSPAYYYYINRIFDGEDYTFIKSEETDGAIELMMENYEFSENIYRIEREWFEGDSLLPKYQWGLAIKQMWSNSLHLSIPDNMTYAPSVKSIYTVIRTTGRNAFSPELFLPAMEYLKQAGYELAGDVLGIWIATIQEEGQEARYMEVWIPIKE